MDFTEKLVKFINRFLILKNMVIDIILLSIAFIALIAATVTDIRTREVPDWLNYGLIFSGIGLRALYSAVAFDWMFLIEGVAGLVVFVGLGYLMFYAAQWGGGDSKLMMGLGALIGLKFTLNPLPLLLVFLFNVLIVGSVYGLIYSSVLAVLHRKRFVREFVKLMHSHKMKKFRRVKLVFLLLVAVLLLLLMKNRAVDIVVLMLLTILVLVLYLSFYLVVFIKAVEKTAMFKWVEPSALTEGDWIAKDVVVNKKRITGPKDLGIDKKQIKQLIAFKKKGKIKKILVKYGIPFVPSFLFAFILTVMLGAWWLILLQ